MTTPDGRAFPGYNHHEREYFYGLTKREWFAGMALSGLVADDACPSVELAVKTSVAMADALIEALNND